MAADLLAIDLDPLEEGLVQEAALGLVGLEVGGLDVVREVQRGVEGTDDRVLLDLVASEQLVGRHALAADALLLLGEDVVADRIVVVRGEKFSLLVVEPDDLGSRASRLLLSNLSERVHVGVDGGADALALFI